MFCRCVLKYLFLLQWLATWRNLWPRWQRENRLDVCKQIETAAIHYLLTTSLPPRSQLLKHTILPPPCMTALPPALDTAVLLLATRQLSSPVTSHPQFLLPLLWQLFNVAVAPSVTCTLFSWLLLIVHAVAAAVLPLPHTPRPTLLLANPMLQLENTAEAPAPTKTLACWFLSALLPLATILLPPPDAFHPFLYLLLLHSQPSSVRDAPSTPHTLLCWLPLMVQAVAVAVLPLPVTARPTLLLENPMLQLENTAEAPATTQAFVSSFPSALLPLACILLPSPTTTQPYPLLSLLTQLSSATFPPLNTTRPDPLPLCMVQPFATKELLPKTLNPLPTTLTASPPPFPSSLVTVQSSMRAELLPWIWTTDSPPLPLMVRLLSSTFCVLLAITICRWAVVEEMHVFCVGVKWCGQTKSAVSLLQLNGEIK